MRKALFDSLVLVGIIILLSLIKIFNWLIWEHNFD